MSLNHFVDKIFCINLDRRVDRWDLATGEFNKLDTKDYERFVAYDNSDNGNVGCTKSHRKLLKDVASGPWEKVLILEDDFQALPYNWDKTYHLNNYHGQEVDIDVIKFYESLKNSLDSIPNNFDIVYLGGHYGSRPLSRVNKNVVKVNTMLTTSSYIITKNSARRLSDEIDSCCDKDCPLDTYLGPIDSIYSSYAPKYNTYCIQPRLFVLRDGISNITQRYESYRHLMMEIKHERKV